MLVQRGQHLLLFIVPNCWFERQAVLGTTEVIYNTFCMENDNRLTPRGAWNNHMFYHVSQPIAITHYIITLVVKRL